MTTIVVSCSSSSIHDREKLDKLHMLKLIEDIIERPSIIIETLENSQYIKCGYYISSIERDERELTGFKNVINYLIKNNYTFEVIDVYDYERKGDAFDITCSIEKRYKLYYAVTKSNGNRDYITFQFFTINGSIIFDGLYQPID